MKKEWTTIHLDGSDLHVFLGDEEFIIESPGKKGARARKLTHHGEEDAGILPAPIVPERAMAEWRARADLQVPYARLVSTDDLEVFLREVTTLFPDPSSVMTQEEEADFYDYLYDKRRFLIWKRYLSVMDHGDLDIMDSFQPVYWRPVLQLLTDSPRSRGLYHTDPALFFLVAVCENPREEKEKALDWTQEDILTSFKLPGEKWFFELISQIPTDRISWELLQSLGSHGVLFGMEELDRYVGEKEPAGLKGC